MDWRVGVLLGGGALAAGTHTLQGSSTARHNGPIFLYIKDKHHNSDWEFFGVPRSPQELNGGGGGCLAGALNLQESNTANLWKGVCILQYYSNGMRSN
jgi:hypothetical protein